MTNKKSNNSTILLIAGLLFIIWSILGMMDAKNYTYTGYNTDDSFTVFRVEEGSPAELAGLQVGDVLKSTGGIAVTDTKALNERQRATIGEVREFIVERNGEEISLNVTFAEQTDMDKNLNRAGDILGLLFIIIGLYANHKFKSELSFAFGVFAVCFGFIFTGGPYISSAILGSFMDVVRTALVLFAVTSMAVYMLKYPSKSGWIAHKNYRMIFWPMILLVAMVAVLEITMPDRTTTLNMITRSLFGLFFIFYFGLALITLVRKYNKSNTGDRSSNGLSLMMVGTLVGLLPLLILFIVGLISPTTEIPGDDYAFLTLAAIPIFFYLALSQVHKSQASST